MLVYVGAHKKLLEALDQRSARIKAELDEARRLRDEAEQAARRIPAQAERGRARGRRRSSPKPRPRPSGSRPKSKTKMEDFVARRTKMAETKIGQAEAQALADVRAAAADAAVAAAEKILTQTAKGKVAEDLIARGIEDVKAKLN